MRVATACLVTLAGLSGACRSSASAEAPSPAGGPSAPARAEAEAGPWLALVEIVDRGADPEDRLAAWLANGDAELRAQAALALGRLASGPGIEGSAQATAALARALGSDPSPAVRANAAFALGLRGDPAAADALLAALASPDAVVRARAVEAASRIDDARLRRELPFALFDTDPRVRRQAALAPHRWTRPAEDDAAGTAEIDHALLEALRRAPDGSPEAPEVERALLFALGRRESALARQAFVEHLRARDAETRVFAAIGLAALALETDEIDRAESRAALVRASGDSDWRVAVEALGGLGRRGEIESLPAIAAGLSHASAHVRRAAAAALGSLSVGEPEAVRAAQTAFGDRSAWVRAAALVSLAALSGEEALATLDEAAQAENALVRAGAAQALAALPAEAAVPRLVVLSRDADPRVRWSAIESLGGFDAPAARAAVHQLLSAEDAGLRLGAVLALAPRVEVADLPALAQASRGTDGLESEIAFEVLAAIARLEGPAPEPLIRAQLTHADPYVAARARELLGARGAELPPLGGAERAPRRGKGRALLVQAAELLSSGARPRVVLRTARGTLVLELDPELAPLHVASFLALVREDHYDDLFFHRVVSDFVVQGGDLRGDGNGSAPFGGRSLRREFGPAPFERGALGMPRNSDPDSGGSQIFLTHRATPHLDGRYTLFGRLVEGDDVLDLIEANDRIVSIEIQAGGR